MVAFLTSGCLVIAGINVSSTTMMRLEQKTYEVGLLRTHGVSSGEIITIFAVQGLVLGVVSSAVGFAFVALVEPYLGALVGQTFRLPISTIVPGSFLSTAPWWLLVLAAGVGVGFSLVGVVIPALRVCRLTPVEALRRRE